MRHQFTEDQLIDVFIVLAEENQRIYNSRVYPSSLRIMGVSTPRLKIFVHENLNDFKQFSSDEKMEILLNLLGSKIFEIQQFAYELTIQDLDFLQLLTEVELLKIYPKNDNWFLIDLFSINILGQLWVSKQVDHNFVAQFLHHKDVLINRISVIACHAFKKLTLEEDYFKSQVSPILLDANNNKQDSIQKALSWTLRVLTKNNKKLILQFLNENENLLSEKIKREVRSKMDTGRK